MLLKRCSGGCRNTYFENSGNDEQNKLNKVWIKRVYLDYKFLYRGVPMSLTITVFFEIQENSGGLKNSVPVPKVQ